MKKGLVSLLLTVSSLFAVSGEDVYIQHCASCHTKDMMINMGGMMQWRKKMQSASTEEKQKMRQKMMKEMRNSDIKAPAMPMVSMRLKHMTSSKKEFIAFVKDYIQNPSKEKGYCMPMAYKRFGTMPPVGKELSEEERDLVAKWLYENFEASWKDFMGGMMCEKKNMKNGSGKCGAGKCGSK